MCAPYVMLARRLRGALHEEAVGGLLADCLLSSCDDDAELARGRLGCTQLDLRARDEALVVEPVEEIAVVLREPHDRRVLARLERGQRL